MTEPIADRAYLAALQQWQGRDSRGPKPTREDFAHLDLAPAEIPEPQPAPPSTFGHAAAAPQPLDEVAQGVLDQMHTALRTRSGR